MNQNFTPNLADSFWKVVFGVLACELAGIVLEFDQMAVV
jgi:hypothetical protein